MDWIKSGWGKELSKNFDPIKNFHMDYSNAIYSDRHVDLIINDAIKKITDIYPPPYTLMMSGGIDSQAMLWCWNKADKPFRIVTIRYVDYNGDVLNEHDISNMEFISDYYNIDIIYIDFNIIQFLENFLLEYATRYQCTSPQITTYMCMSEMIYDGTVLFSGDFLFTGIYNYTVLGLKRYADISNRSIIPFFLLHDPELTTLLHRTFNQQSNKDYHNAKNEDRKKRGYLQKVYAMQSLGIKLFPQAIKYSGFEKVKNLYDQRYDLVTTKDRLKFSNNPSKRLFDINFRYKLTDTIKYIDDVVPIGLKSDWKQ